MRYNRPMGRRADAVIFGAGPAGLATAHRLVEKGRKVIIVERDSQVGGLSKTIEFKKCRFDLGGHRFFTKSKKVNELWENTLGEDLLNRPRLSRICYNNNKFFDYPIRPFNALRGFGFFMSATVILSYIRSKICPYKEERTFEQWVTNRFGRKLFETFFKIYTEKLWAVPCSEIEAEWAAQRIRGLSLKTALKNAIFPDKKGSIKTLIHEFKYPKYGPGMMYEKLAGNISCKGASINLNAEVVKIVREDFLIKGVIVRNKDGTDHTCNASHFVSSIPITETIKRLSPQPPKEVLAAAFALKYRSFIAVNVILDSAALFPDTWIYIHAPQVRLGRI